MNEYNMSDLDPLIRNGASTSKFEGTVQPFLAELVGTTLFVFVGCLSTQNGQLTPIGLAHGLAIALLILAFGKISGGHFNPCVTLGVTLARGLTAGLAVCYFFAQLLGGLLGAAFVRAVLSEDIYKAIRGGAQTLGDIKPGWAILTEAILTFILVLTVLLTAVDDKYKTELAPIAIGFAVAVDIMAAGATTGASMNPARSLGPAVVYSIYGSIVWTDHYVYWVGPLSGAFLAAVIYRFVFASVSRRFGRY